jgi:hypothetical protein
MKLLVSQYEGSWNYKMEQLDQFQKLLFIVSNDYEGISTEPVGRKLYTMVHIYCIVLSL